MAKIRKCTCVRSVHLENRCFFQQTLKPKEVVRLLWKTENSIEAPAKLHFRINYSVVGEFPEGSVLETTFSVGMFGQVLFSPNVVKNINVELFLFWKNSPTALVLNVMLFEYIFMKLAGNDASYFKNILLLKLQIFIFN